MSQQNSPSMEYRVGKIVLVFASCSRPATTSQHGPGFAGLSVDCCRLLLGPIPIKDLHTASEVAQSMDEVNDRAVPG